MDCLRNCFSQGLLFVTFLVITLSAGNAQEIVYSSAASGSMDIWAINANGIGRTNISQIAHDPAGIYTEDQPGWSPNGSQIIFTSNKSGCMNIWIMDANGLNDYNLTNSGAQETCPRWGPDGLTIYFARTIYCNGGGCGPCPYFDIYSYNLQTKVEARLTINSTREQTPVVSPNGSQIVYVKSEWSNDCCNTTDLWIMNSDGTNPQYFFGDSHLYEWVLDWGRLTNRILVSKMYSWGAYEIAVLSADLQTISRLTEDAYYDCGFAFSPDESMILFLSNRGGSNELWIMNIEDKCLTQLTNESANIGWADWKSSNSRPSANAGDNLNLSTEKLSASIVVGNACDQDIHDVLSYRWLKDEIILKDWSLVGPSGECPLELGMVFLPIGTHFLQLQVSDGKDTVSDEMILTVDNSSPHAAPSGSGVYELFSSVSFGGFVSDYDGDLLGYEWISGADILFSGLIQSQGGGEPVELPFHIINNLGIGSHTIALQVNDGINEPVAQTIAVKIVDSTVPTLSPIADKSILWPPDHKMVSITIKANASDKSGMVTLEASVRSNEPEDGLGDGDMAPDYTTPIIDNDTGTITLQLRSERSGAGIGRMYTIVITASDSSGNRSEVSITVQVPHDKRK